MDDSINQHVIQKLEGSVLVTDPFPYFYVADIFPDSFYSYVNQLFPEEYYLTSNDEKTYKALAISLKERKTLAIFNKFIKYSEISSYPYANECIKLREWFYSFLIPAVATKLSVNLDLYDDDTRFVVDYEGYVKRPHTDVPNKLFSILLYMSNSRRGTTVLRPKKDGFTDDFGYDHQFHQFDEVYTAPFVPNALFAFKRTDTSFHSVRRLESGEYRKAIHINVRKLVWT